MKIKIEFSRTLPQTPSGDILQLLPGSSLPQMDVLQSYVKTWGIAVVTPPFLHERQYVMACITPEETILQPMCFPEDKAISPGNDIYPISFSWGKAVLCCEDDMFQPQYARLAAIKGCSLMLAAFPWEDQSLIMAGPWSVCQANCLPIALAQPGEGQLILPCPMTPDHSGFGRKDYDTDELDRAYREFPVFDSLNPNFYEKFREVLK